PTHFTEHSHSLIDLFIDSNKNRVIYSGVGDPFLQQDIRYHCPIYGILNFCKPRQKAFSRRIWKYEQGNYQLLRQKALETDWNSLQHNNINIYAQNITKEILTIAESCIPNKTVTIRPSDPPWITTAIKRYIRKRKRAYRRARLTNEDRHWTKFRHLRNTVTSMIRESKRSYKQSLSDKLKSGALSSKQWWSVLKYFLSQNNPSCIPPLEKDGIVYSDETDKANLLNDFFRDQTLLNDKDAVLPYIVPYTVQTPLQDIVLAPNEVKEILKSLPTGKASGPDGISNRVLKELSSELSAPLSSFFNRSFHIGEVPDTFKVAHVTPVPKGGDRSVVSNNRPISLLSNLDKTQEKLVFKHLYNHFRENNIITSFQSGFTPGDSTVNQLTFLYHTFCQALDSGKEVRVVFCDIKKAFDRVWHAGLIHKLKAAGISGSLLKWFASYLSDRKQKVVLPGAQSNWNSIHAGVPQGSILGPLLFLLYINDIVTDIGSNIRLFADDTSLYIIVDNPNAAAELINSDLVKISNWAHIWLVDFNAAKNEALLLSRKLNRPIHPPVYMLNHEINEVQFHKHLGIYFSEDCSWHKHIDYIKERAWTRINLMRKFKYDLDRKSLETIYISFIRPVLEYADVIWDNCSQQEKIDLEKIQNEAARIATGTTKLVSLQKLYEEIGWETLEARRKKHKLVLFYKMFYNLTPPYLSSLVPPQVQHVSRYSLRNANNVQTLPSHTTQYYNSFLPFVIREWNNLPDAIRNVDTVESFKRNINQNTAIVPKHYYSGSRQLQVSHTRLRTGCSSLNNDLFLKNIVESPLCECRSGEIENAEHFFFKCKHYNEHRLELLQTVSQFCNVTLDVLLKGNINLSFETNVEIFKSVQKYIQSTKRF
ncbi:MAG: reverse transcriptase family protein, partial [Candidatus Thiodiazotropha taylori]|nr:reverse transcriptase family protein [Candidatus Thiodiazotropha taylori]MCW4335129.1 reverse transcriptase family protein [Candidatus Thiodiazotropha endolucinida]